MGYSVSQTAEACGVSRSVLYGRMQQVGISYRDRFSRLDNNSLDAAVRDIKMNHPNCGEVMIIGHLRARGIIVQRSRVRESIHRVDPQGADIGGAEEFAVEFILCHAQTSSGTWTVITNSFVGALLYMLA